MRALLLVVLAVTGCRLGFDEIAARDDARPIDTTTGIDAPDCTTFTARHFDACTILP